MTRLTGHRHAGHAGAHHADDGDAVCPVCRARVDSRTAPMQVRGGDAWYFCDDRCRNAFDRRPDFYVERARSERSR